MPLDRHPDGSIFALIPAYRRRGAAGLGSVFRGPRHKAGEQQDQAAGNPDRDQRDHHRHRRPQVGRV